jgi:hypothetical protein
MNFKRAIIFAFAAAVAFIGTGTDAFAAKGRREANFTVRIENVSNAVGFETAGGAKYPFALSPGFFIIDTKTSGLFTAGKKASAELEAQAEDGNPELFLKHFLTRVGGLNIGVFNKPEGSMMPAPILPGQAYEFTFRAKEGMRLNLIAMFGQSNDLFYAPESSFELFDKKGDPFSGEITDSFMLWDAGTEVNQAPGIGDEQAPRQKAVNTGKAENGRVGKVADGFMYPSTKDVLRITITAK